MGFREKMKPGINRRYLVFVAALVWTAAAVILLKNGIKWQADDSQYLIILHIYSGVVGGLLFYYALFARISYKHIKRIFLVEDPKPCIFSFFDGRSYFLMAIMIAAGITLRSLHIFNKDNLGTFYIAMGIPLMMSAIRFWYFGLRYSRFMAGFKNTLPPSKGTRSRLRSWIYRIYKWSLSLFFIVSAVILFCNYTTVLVSSKYVYSDTLSIPANMAGLVLGTSKNTAKGYENLFFKYRIEAAAALYKAGKIKYIILSGDNGSDYYNEPLAMKIQLLRLGVPSDAIYLDYAGFRTLDSVLRGRDIFGQAKFTVISQGFQNERAVYIAKHFGIEAIGFNARDVKTYSGFKTNVRELLARVKMFIDLYITNAQPRFLGEKIIIGG